MIKNQNQSTDPDARRKCHETLLYTIAGSIEDDSALQMSLSLGGSSRSLLETL